MYTDRMLWELCAGCPKLLTAFHSLLGQVDSHLAVVSGSNAFTTKKGFQPLIKYNIVFVFITHSFQVGQLRQLLIFTDYLNYWLENEQSLAEFSAKQLKISEIWPICHEKF